MSNMLSKILTGLTAEEWEAAWRDVRPSLLIAYTKQVDESGRISPLPLSFSEWKAEVIFEGKNRRFIHYAYGERIGLRAGVLEVVNENKAAASEIRNVPLCTLDHRCVVCGALTLPAGHHGLRGSMTGTQCMGYFNVRCSQCQAQGKLPDLDRYIPWFELNDEETRTHLASDGRQIFFEVM